VRLMPLYRSVILPSGRWFADAMRQAMMQRSLI
jgi:hypothetical protein